MKKITCFLLILVLGLSLCACGEEPAPAPEVEPEEENAEPVFYEGHGIRYEVPGVWVDSFISYYKEFGEGDTAFTLLEFMTVIGGDEAGVLTIASFNEQSWARALEQTPDAEKLLIGTSADGKTYYTIRFADTKFENSEHQAKFDQVLTAAKEKSKSIQIID